MNFKRLTLDKCKNEYEQYVKTKDFVDFSANLDVEYQNLRKDLVELAGTVTQSYDYDLNFGIKLYEYFSKIDGFNESIASDYDFWRYLSIKVVTDIVEKRHGLVPSYYYEKNVRIYLSTLWWYIHLTYQGNMEDTYNCLKDLNTDYILQLVERPGKNGVYLDIMRCIIKYISKLPESERNKKFNGANLFRRVMIQNTAKVDNYNLLFDGKVERYVVDLFESCNVSVDYE
jgi:hypothetical protein